MGPAPVPLDLGSGQFRRLLEQVSGSHCSVTFDTPKGPETASARIWPEERSGVILQFTEPMWVFPTQVMVEIPSCRLTFESVVLHFLGDTDFTLYHPLWATAPPPAEEDVSQVSFPLRYALKGTAEWNTGSSVEIRGHSISFVGKEPLPVGAGVELRIRVPQQPLPMLALTRVTNSVTLSHEALIEVLLVACSFQTEHALAKALGRPLLTGHIPEGGRVRVV